VPHRRGLSQAGATLLLEHRGRKSGTVSVTPLLYPQWYRNLVANPDTYVEIGS